MPQKWTTVTAFSVRVGDRVIPNVAGPPRLVAIRDMRTAPRGGKRLVLEDGTHYTLPLTGTLPVFTQPGPD